MAALILESPVEHVFDGMTPEQIIECLRDRAWRMSHLYCVLDKNNNTVVFKPNLVQKAFLNRLWYRNVVPKARQRGFSTVTQIALLDDCLFVPNTKAGIIAQDRDTAKAIRSNKVVFALDRLPSLVKAMVGALTVNNVDKLEWANGSTLMVSTSVRGLTLNWLHISEYGKLCKTDPAAAMEVRDGSLPAVDKEGIVVIESTAEGRTGDFFDKVMTAKATADMLAANPAKRLTNLDYRLHFASWWDAAEYELDPDDVVMSPADHAYFERMEGLIEQPIGPRKRAWYVKTRDVTFGGQNESMWSQYPTTLDEAFQVSTNGLWFANEMSLARQQGRVGLFPPRHGVQTHTFWDLGKSDLTAIWFMQINGGFYDVVDFYQVNDVPWGVVVTELFKKPYLYGRHFLPHDATHEKQQAWQIKSTEEELNELGLRNTVIVPRIDSVVRGINMLRQDLATMRFHEPHTKEGLACVDGYAKSWNKVQQLWVDVPAKNGCQHAADALRQKAQAEDAGLISSAPGRSSKLRRRNGSAMAS